MVSRVRGEATNHSWRPKHSTQAEGAEEQCKGDGKSVLPPTSPLVYAARGDGGVRLDHSGGVGTGMIVPPMKMMTWAIAGPQVSALVATLLNG